MKSKILLLLLMAAIRLQAQPAEVVRNYVATYAPIAISEMQRTGVPASITLAQGILESYSGQSDLVRRSNNHFGIKCKSEWTGPSVSHDDDARGECFRKYESPEASYRDHSDFLRNRKHYAFLFDLDPADYEAWAHGLKKAGYATNPKYPQLLIRLINEYNLNDYTLVALGKKAPSNDAFVALPPVEREAPMSGIPTPPAAEAKAKRSYPSGVFYINATPVVFVQQGTAYLQVAQKHNVPLARLFDFNDIRPADLAEVDGLVFLQRKRRTGDHSVHVVYEGETLYDIAQEEGIRLESLLSFNGLRSGDPLMPGTQLYLDGPAPALRATVKKLLNGSR